MAFNKKYHVHIDSDSTGLAHYFASVENLAGFILSQQEGNIL
jgi:hypothetical protein